MSMKDRIVRAIARLAMAASLAYYTITLAIGWIGGLVGNTAVLNDMMDLPEGAPLPDAWRIAVGILFSGIALGSLAVAYWSVHMFLLRFGRGDVSFDATADALRRIAFGLVGFWIGYNLIFGAMSPILTAGHPPEFRAAFDWDPLDIDIILLILGITLYAVSRVLRRAHEIEEENRHFL